MAKWFPQESFELAINKDEVPALVQQGYLNVPAREREEWLRRHFYVRAGFPGCDVRTYLGSLVRVRRACWRQLRPRILEAVRGAPVISGVARSKGHPHIARKRLTTIALVLHQPANPIPKEWQWSLAELLVTPAELLDSERLWFGLRPYVLSTAAARACIECVCRIVTDAYAVTKIDVVNSAHDALKQYHSGNSSLDAAKQKAVMSLQNISDKEIVELYTEAFDALPWRALHRVVGAVPKSVPTPALVTDISECVLQKMV